METNLDLLRWTFFKWELMTKNELKKKGLVTILRMNWILQSMKIR